MFLKKKPVGKAPEPETDSTSTPPSTVTTSTATDATTPGENSVNSSSTSSGVTQFKLVRSFKAQEPHYSHLNRKSLALHKGELYVPSRDTINIVNSTDGTTKGTIQFVGPVGVAVDKEGFIYIGKQSVGPVTKVNRAGEVVLTIGTQGTEKSQLGESSNMTVNNESEELFVCDSQYGGVKVFNYRTGEWKRTMGYKGWNTPQQMTLPREVKRDGKGRVYVSDWGNKRMQVYEEESGKFLGTIGVYDYKDQVGCFTIPLGVGVDSKGRVIVGDSGKKLLLYDKFIEGGAGGESGRFLCEFYAEKDSDIVSFACSSVVVDSNDKIYVLDDSDGMVHVFVIIQ